jgi:glutathione peroxidase
MSRSRFFLLLAFAFSLATAAGCAKDPPGPSGTAGPQTKQDNPMSFHDFSLKTIDGQDRSLGEYRGKVLLVVNTASECGYTRQYAGLEKLHERFEARGFAVLGFPSNDFGGQEPGSETEIKSFCTTKFGVTFPMFAKIPVKGDGKHPLYAFLTQQGNPAEVRWNFTKFLVGKDGSVIGRFESKVEPEDPQIVSAVEKALGT